MGVAGLHVCAHMLACVRCCRTEAAPTNGEAVQEQLDEPDQVPPGPPEKAIVFSQWPRMLALVEAALRRKGIRFARLDGSMSVTARESAIRTFAVSACLPSSSVSFCLTRSPDTAVHCRARARGLDVSAAAAPAAGARHHGHAVLTGPAVRAGAARHGRADR